jgi:hypothetical protein
MCPHRFYNELRYWQLLPSYVQACCAAQSHCAFCDDDVTLAGGRTIEHEPLLCYSRDSTPFMLTIDKQAFNGEHLFREQR